MADNREVGIGVATVLASTTSPEPFPIVLGNQSLADAALIVRNAIRECVDAGVSLHTVKVGLELHQHLLEGHLPEPSFLGVQIKGQEELGTELLFYRQQPVGG
jgi:hypothetical protein